MSLFLAAIGALSFQSLSRFGESITWVDHTHDVIEMFDELELDVREGESALRAYILTNDLSQRDEYRKQAFDELNFHLKEVRSLAADDPVQLSRLDPIEAMLRQRVTIMEKTRTSFEADPKNSALQATLIRPGVELTDKVVVKLNEFRDAERRILADRLAKRSSESGVAMNAILASGSLGIGCACLGLFIILRGLHKRREAEARLRESLAEKEVLLREVHHRVKNNLQVISSLLSLDSEKLKDPQAVSVFRECRDRIQLIARLHEQIYSREQFARVAFGEHLREVAEVLVQTHRTPGCSVSLKVEIDPVDVDLDTAVTLGLIANEVILNSLKHAFVGRDTGTLTVQLRHGAQREMKVFDDGIGLPPGFNPKKSGGIGLELVNGLTRQIHGEATIQNCDHGGTCTIIHFPA